MNPQESREPDIESSATTEDSWDPKILRYLKATDEMKADSYLVDLIEDAARIIADHIGYKEGFRPGPSARSTSRVESRVHNPRADRLEDVYHEAILVLIERLLNVRENYASQSKNQRPIRNFHGYVETVTDHLLGRRSPIWLLLKERLLYVLKHYRSTASQSSQLRFALRLNDKGRLFCWFADQAWPERFSEDDISVEELRSYRQQNQGLQRVLELLGLPGPDLPEDNAAGNCKLIAALFQFVGHPITLSDLVNCVFDLRGLKEIVVESSSGSSKSDEGSDPIEIVPDSRPSPERADEQEIEIGMALRRLRRWFSKVSQLPLLQQQAYLLHHLHFFAGVESLVSLGKIAEMLKIPEAKLREKLQQLKKGAERQDQQPRRGLSDEIIAELIGSSRGAVTVARHRAIRKLNLDELWEEIKNDDAEEDAE